MTESAFNRPVPVQEQQAALKAEPKPKSVQLTDERGPGFEGTFQGDPIISNPAMPPGVVARVRLTAEQIEATKHLKPGEAFAKAVAGIGESLGKVLEPEPAKKPEDLDGF